MNNTITYKGYTIRIRKNQYTNRANGYHVLTSWGPEFFPTLARAKSFIKTVEG